MIQADMKVNPDGDQQPQQPPHPSDDQSAQHSIENSPETLDNQDLNQNNFHIQDQNEQPEIQPETDVLNNNNNAPESTAYSYKSEKSSKQPLIIRLRNPAPPKEDKTNNTSSNPNNKSEADSTEEIPDEDKWKCPICLDALQQPVVTRCGHVFCWPCIHEWLRRSNTCPVCHGEIEESHLIPIYGQGDEADISSPPPPRPEYREARPNNGFNFVFRTPFATRNITDQVHALFRPGPYLIIQIVAIVFFFSTFYI